MTPTAPFYRHGQPVPLTTEDYARRAGVRIETARGTLRKLMREGAVTRAQSGAYRPVGIRGPKPATYIWRGRAYIGIKAVAAAARRSVSTVSHHLERHGNLDRLGMGPSCNFPKDGRGACRRPVQACGRAWPSLTALVRDTGRSYSTVKAWVDAKDEDRILAALMQQEARR